MIRIVIDYFKRYGVVNIILLSGYLINPFFYGFVFGYILVIWILFRGVFFKKSLDVDFLLLFFFSICYALFYSVDPWRGNQYILMYLLIPPFFYLWGKYFRLKAENQQNLFFLLISFGFIFSISPLISVWLDIIKNGFVQNYRNIPMFWSTESMGATGMAALLTFNMCLPAILLSSFRKLGLVFKIYLITLFILSLVCVLRLGSRTQLLITLLTFFVVLIYLIPQQSLKQNIILFGLLVLSGFFVFKNISFDLDADWLTSFAGRMEKGNEEIASGGGRTERWAKSFSNLIDKPLGWKLEEFGYSHNLWLDVLRVGGAISFFLLVIYSIRSCILLKKAISSNSSNLRTKIVLLSYFLGLFLLFMVEPIIDGSFHIFAFFCLLIGIIKQQVQSIQKNL